MQSSIIVPLLGTIDSNGASNFLRHDVRCLLAFRWGCRTQVWPAVLHLRLFISPPAVQQYNSSHERLSSVFNVLSWLRHAPVFSLFCAVFQDLLREHVVVTLFLTMLVGAGGNAGNQSAIKVWGSKQ